MPLLELEHYCLRGARWEDQFVGQLVEHGFNNVSLDDPARVNTIGVEHWRVADRLLAEAEGVPPGPDAFIRVYHADCDPQTRVCATCGKRVGTGA